MERFGGQRSGKDRARRAAADAGPPDCAAQIVNALSAARKDTSRPAIAF
jgi:hypothetical protein